MMSDPEWLFHPSSRYQGTEEDSCKRWSVESERGGDHKSQDRRFMGRLLGLYRGKFQTHRSEADPIWRTANRSVRSSRCCCV